MRTRRLAHLDNATLLGRFRELVSQERVAVATLLEHLGEVDARRLHLPAGYSSMFEYCVREFGWTRQTTFKRIGASRAARRFPEILSLIAEGKLNVSGVVMLRPKLTRANAAELLVAAAGRSNAEIELLLAARFPREDVPTRVAAISVPQIALRTDVSAGALATPNENAARDLLSARIVEMGQTPTSPPCPARVSAGPPAAPARLTPLAPERFALQVTIAGDTHALLRRAQELLSHQCVSGDVAQVLHRALQGLVRDLEKRKYAATERPRAPRGQEPKGRTIPAHVRRAVRQRDGDQCTFVGENGHRCASRRQLEFDHVQPIALGGTATVDGIRLRCRAHNQFDAERVFGMAFMATKREGARAARAG